MIAKFFAFLQSLFGEKPVQTVKVIVTNSKLANVRVFVEKFAEAAIRSEETFDLPAEAMLAQAALETGWGKHITRGVSRECGKTVSSNNLFNITEGSSWDGDVVTRRGVLEYTKDGKPYRTTVSFRRYLDFVDSFDDYGELITGLRRYREAVASAHDPEEYLKEIQAGGYASDRKYAKKCIQIMRKYFVVGREPVASGKGYGAPNS